MKVALVIVDAQVAFFTSDEPVYKGAEVLTRLKRLIWQARGAGVPVVYVQHDGRKGGELDPGSPGWQIHPDICPAPEEIIVRKHTPDAFLGTQLHNELSSMGVISVIIAGFQSECCIDTTCRRAWSLGYEVTLVRDCHSTFDSAVLSAAQISAHHSDILGRFATVIPASEIKLA